MKKIQIKNRFTGNVVIDSVPSHEEIKEPIQNALYATDRFHTEEATELAEGIIQYITDAGYKIVRL